jgi:hypothetical protein
MWWLFLDRSLELSEHPDEERAQDPLLASTGCKAQDREWRPTTALQAFLLPEVLNWPWSEQESLLDPEPRAQAVSSLPWPR